MQLGFAVKRLNDAGNCSPRNLVARLAVEAVGDHLSARSPRNKTSNSTKIGVDRACKAGQNL
jgi:hypothetical protein